MRIEKNYAFTVPQGSTVQRADAFLSSCIPELSRSALTGELCEIYVNGVEARKSSKVRAGDSVELFYAAEVFENIEKQDIPLDIIYEDKSMLVINKKNGMVVHPGAGNPDGTVVNALAWRYGDSFIQSMADECDITRPGIVHRLDKDTSGVLVIALTPQAHAELARQFQEHSNEKYYYALCDGIFEKRHDKISCLLGRDPNNRKLFTVVRSGGKDSLSEYSVVRQFEDCALVKVRIYTGRTHQIRVHMKSIGHPVVGDVLYNKKISRFPGYPLMLHSFSLDINHPETGERMHFEAELPASFEKYLTE